MTDRLAMIGVPVLFTCSLRQDRRVT